ncbi:hypothetical protein KSF_033710 [Reticulibacter mediterranei]|uniref:Uncharacterized protein n=1 Tax=Reticulibacter mediterranei TaxID=2778369 RepID=A0A8J3N2B1_9CHLR|nr:hypothetical protein [Reticulibacter mediterranei]GHO93323.1 hypothetical protein KSF_033710 [Reticulibacter mediterranei]
MSEAKSPQGISYLSNLEQVASEYRHRPKVTRPGPALVTPAVHLKWYDIYYEETPVSAQLVDQARSFLLAELEAGRLPLKNEIGFVVHHQCSAAYILYISTWRNENELWETIYIKDLAANGTFQQLERSATTPTYCVWVLGVVGHEQQAWTRYLYSPRDNVAKYAYVQDQMTGPV